MTPSEASNPMETLTLRIKPLSAFGTPMLGDTLFGHVCWALRNRHGEARLEELLEGYVEGMPFLVLSDAMPAGHVPRPVLPEVRADTMDPSERKAQKGRRWLPVGALGEPARWAETAVDLQLEREHPQPHNTIDRTMGSTGKDPFVPYTQLQRWFSENSEFTCFALYDPERIGADLLACAFEDVGASGFGRDASIGLGRFAVEATAEGLPRGSARGGSWLTLAPCAPQGCGLDPSRSYYQVFTRFGRHGDVAVHQGSPFKTPVLLARAGALLTPAEPRAAQWVGRGLGGEGRMSLNVRGTVHQGYAPVVTVEFPQETMAP